MSAKLLTAPEREGSTFGLAVRILGVMAVGTVVWYGWAVLIRFDGREREALAEVRDRPVQAPREPVERMGEAVGVDPVVPLPAVPLPPVAAAPGATGIVSAEVGMKGMAVEHPAHQIPNKVAAELTAKALQMREQGDTQGCLQALKEAGDLQKGHPKILAELATTYSQIGQEAKAAAHWEMVHRMGPGGAGTYWDLADMSLKGELLDDNTPVNDALRVSRHLVRAVSGKEGADQRMILRIQIEAVGKEAVDYRKMYLQVYFYDMVNGSRFEQTIADTRPQYVSAPYDWKNGEEEIIEVEYHLPELSPEQVAQLGTRSFFGYLIELYYNDVLQDLVAAPRKLARFGSASAPVRESGS
jgi:hypothetical protein